MTEQKLLEVVKFYEESKLKFISLNEGDDLLKHLHQMCREIRTNHVIQGKIGKAFRWLGFIQGVLVAKGIYTIEDVKSHSRTRES